MTQIASAAPAMMLRPTHQDTSPSHPTIASDAMSPTQEGSIIADLALIGALLFGVEDVDTRSKLMEELR